MAAYTKDLQLTLEIITLLKSGFTGQFAFDKALSTLQSGFGPDDYTQTAQRASERLDAWFEDLYNDIPIFATSWDAPETFDAISALNFLRDLKRDIQWLLPFVEEALATQNISQNPEALKLLAATIFRCASGRAAYVDAMYQSLTFLKVSDVAQQVAFEIEPAREQLQTAQSTLNTLASISAYPADLCERVRFQAGLIPCDLRSQIHDINVLLNAYTKDFNFEIAEFTREEAIPWIKAQIPPVAAGYWRAYNFSPDDFLAWEQVGISGAPLAAQWHRCYFTPEVAVRWIRQGFSPTLALPWFKAGFEPPRAAAMIKRGVTDPAKAPKSSSTDEQDE